MKISESFNPCKGFYDPNQLFVDGGVMGRNPSPIGGTWAVRIVEKGRIITEWSGVLLANDETPLVTNNMTEMLALIKGITLLPFEWRGTIFSDSKITLGRVFAGWSRTNLPEWMWSEIINQKARLVHWNQIHYGLLDGHPTQIQLEGGLGKRGHPVSIHNKWCDEECGRVGKHHLKLSKDKT